MKKAIIAFNLVLVSILAMTARDFGLPVVPDDLKTPNERARYVLEHYWDAMDWRDTTLTYNDKFMEQLASDFYSVFHVVDSVAASEAVAIMLAGASSDPYAYKKVADIARIYLYNSESPIADDENYLVVADRLLADGKLSDADLLRVADSKRMAMMNRVGHKASDFEYVDRKGNISTLYEALKRHPQNILIFYDPDCHVCAELEERLMAMELGDMGVVMISPYGEQDGLWSEHASTMPVGWIVGRPTNEDFEDEEIYELRMTPTILIIDNHAMVLSKGKLQF